jgi:uncharacterized RDD family membrane protein YckC
MARWRDIKQNRTTTNNKNRLKKDTQQSNNIVCASVLNRFKSYVVDTFMITMPIMYFVIYLVIGSLQEFSAVKLYGWGIIFALHALAILAFWLIKQESPGMRAYELKLINNNPEKSINIVQYLIRYIVTVISSVTLLCLVPLFRKDNQALQDMLSGTSIISVEK